MFASFIFSKKSYATVVERFKLWWVNLLNQVRCKPRIVLYSFLIIRLDYITAWNDRSIKNNDLFRIDCVTDKLLHYVAITAKI